MVWFARRWHKGAEGFKCPGVPRLSVDSLSPLAVALQMRRAGSLRALGPHWRLFLEEEQCVLSNAFQCRAQSGFSVNCLSENLTDLSDHGYLKDSVYHKRQQTLSKHLNKIIEINKSFIWEEFESNLLRPDWGWRRLQPPADFYLVSGFSCCLPSLTSHYFFFCEKSSF